MKKIFTVLVALMAVMSLSAKTLYFNSGAWATEPGRFAIYCITGESWEDLIAVAEETNVYSATVGDSVTDVVFCRMNPDSLKNQWSSLWNQTEDLNIPEGKDMYTITGWGEGYGAKATGEWSKYGDDPAPVEGDYYIKNNWNGGEWAWKAMTKDGENYKLENVVFGGSGVNWNSKMDDKDAIWVAADKFAGDKVAALDTISLMLNVADSTITATLLGKYIPTGDEKYYMKNCWNGGEWAWLEMAKDGDNYKLEGVIYGGSGVNYNTMKSDDGATWVAGADFLGDKIVAKDSVTLVLDPKAGSVTAILLKHNGDDPVEPTEFYLVGSFNDWKADEAHKFAPNGESEGEYVLHTTLAVDDKVKVMGVAGEAQIWYPDGMDNEYKVDAEHAGDVTVYFRPVRNSEWEAFGGYIFIEKTQGVENTAAAVKAIKRIENGMMVIEQNGKKFNAQGAQIK